MVLDVLQILVSEVPQCSKNGIWRGLAEATESTFLDRVSQGSKGHQIFGVALSMADSFKYFHHVSCAYPAGNTLSAGLLLGKIGEVFCHVDNAGVFVHDDKPAGTHDRSGAGKGFVVNGKIEEFL